MHLADTGAAHYLLLLLVVVSLMFSGITLDEVSCMFFRPNALSVVHPSASAGNGTLMTIKIMLKAELCSSVYLCNCI